MKKKKIAEGGIAAIIFIVIVAFAYGVSWITTCGVIKLVTMCFDLTFKWLTATGIWLILILVSNIFKSKG